MKSKIFYTMIDGVYGTVSFDFIDEKYKEANIRWKIEICYLQERRGGFDGHSE